MTSKTVKIVSLLKTFSCKFQVAALPSDEKFSFEYVVRILYLICLNPIKLVAPLFKY